MIKFIPGTIPHDPVFMISGGVDSVAAAHWLATKARKKISAIHFNHNVQPANEAMQTAVCELCASLDIPLMIVKNTTACKLNEASLRHWRLTVLKGIKGNFLSAHHVGDAIENYLNNCLKGCPEYKPIKEKTEFDGFTISHPFLTTRKSDFEKYARQNNLDQFICPDPTNADTSFNRNWIRKLISESEDRGKGLEKVVLKKFYKKRIDIGGGFE